MSKHKQTIPNAGWSPTLISASERVSSTLTSFFSFLSSLRFFLPSSLLFPLRVLDSSFSSLVVAEVVLVILAWGGGGVKLENLWNKKSPNQLCWQTTQELITTKQTKASRFCSTASHHSSVRKIGILTYHMHMKTKKKQNWLYCKSVENKKSQGQKPPPPPQPCQHSFGSSANGFEVSKAVSVAVVSFDFSYFFLILKSTGKRNIIKMVSSKADHTIMLSQILFVTTYIDSFEH